MARVTKKIPVKKVAPSEVLGIKKDTHDLERGRKGRKSRKSRTGKLLP